jgi:hypothetical protein
MPRHLISDAHEWINEIPTVPIYYLAKPQPRERAWQNQRGKKTLKASSMGSKIAHSLLVQRPTICRRPRARQPGTGEPKGAQAPTVIPWRARWAVVTRGKVSVPGGVARGLRYVLIPGESLRPVGAPAA